jgi:hypothetical protein
VSKKQTKIYAYEHAIKVFFPGNTRAYILPAGMKILIKENLIKEKTGTASYSKLKKERELNMRSYKLPVILNPLAERDEERLAYSIHQQDVIIRQMIDFAVNEPLTWVRWRNKTFLE